MTHPNAAHLDRAAALISRAASLLVITGAGISAESGVPTYRDTGGVYDDPEAILDQEDLTSNPLKVWTNVDALRQMIHGCRPNRAHTLLSEWEHAGRFKRFLVATQNVDGFHHDAGSKRVTEIHGNIWEMAEPAEPGPMRDDDYFALMDAAQSEEVLARWSRENNHTVWENKDVPFPTIPPYTSPTIRPNIVLFNEQYGLRLVWVEAYIQKGVDCVLVVGCSGAVWTLERLMGLALRLPHICYAAHS